MPSSKTRGAAILFACLALFGCSKPKPKPPPPPPPEAPPPPPPPPKCEALSENCRAKTTTLARIADTGYVFTPPEGWLYAQEEDATITFERETGPVLVLTSYQFDKNGFKRKKEYIEKLSLLAERVGVKTNKSSIVLLEPVRDKIDDLGFEMWDRYNSKAMTGAKRNGSANGGMLILSAPIETSYLFGFAFAELEDTDGTAAVTKSIQSLAKAGSEKESSEKDDSK